jgi:heme exporter protein D
MDSLSSFLHMGGYAGFVWPSFAITILVMTVLLVASLRSLKARESALAALQGDAPRATRREATGET